MRSFAHYARYPDAVADAERALLAWRHEAARQQRRLECASGIELAVTAAEREIAAARDFLAPPDVSADLATLGQAVDLLLQAQAARGTAERVLADDDHATRTARLLVWQAPDHVPMRAGDRAARLRLRVDAPEGAAALRAAVAYGRDLVRVNLPK